MLRYVSFDWSMSAVPLVERWSDTRNLMTSAFYVSLILMTWRIVRDLNRPTPPSVCIFQHFDNHTLVLLATSLQTNRA